MDNQDQARTHTQGPEGHGVHVCHKCGWLFPNPHPSAKQRRAHKKICGTIEGSKLLVSDDERLFDDDCNTHVDSVPKSLDTGENEKQCGGTGENLIRSGDEVFLDAIANFSDGALSVGIRDPLRDSLESATDVEIVDTKYAEFSGYYEGNCQNAAGASENVGDCNLTSFAKEINPKGRDEIMSETDMVEIAVSSSNIVGETCEGVPKLAASDVVNSDCQLAGGAFNLKVKNNAEFLSMMPHDELLLEGNLTVRPNGSGNGVQVESADMIQFATCSGVKMSQERGEGKLNVFTHSLYDEGPDAAHPQSKYEDAKDHEGVLLQNSLSLHSSEALKQKRDDLKDSVAGENHFFINQHQLSERRDVLPDVHVLDSSMKRQKNSELVDEEMHAEESNGVSFVNFMVESDNRSVETGTSMNDMKTEMIEGHMIHFSEEQVSVDVRKSSQQISLPECNYMAASKDNLSDDRSMRMRKDVECTDKGPLSGAQEDIKDVKDDEINSNGRGNEECNRFVGSSVDSYRAQDEEVILKAAQCISVVEDTQDEEPGREVSGSTAVPVQDQSFNSEDKLASSAIYTSVDPGSCFDNFSFKGNSSFVSVSGLPSTNLLASTEVNLKGPALERQQCEKPEMFEPPSFMTLVEPGYVVGPKAAASEVHKGMKTNENTSSQAGWFPTTTQITNESKGRKRNEEKIAEITNCSPKKQHAPLKTLLSEAAHNKKPKSPKLEENSANQKNSEVQEDNSFGLRTGNSIPGRESPATQAVKGKDGKEWNSPVRYPAGGTKRRNKKVKGRPYWIQFVCCSSANPQRS